MLELKSITAGRMNIKANNLHVAQQNKKSGEGQ